MWQEVGRYILNDGTGSTETMILERSKNGTFRLRNEYGNVNIEFDTMTGIEFVRNLFDDVKDQIEDDINYIDNFWDFDDDITDKIGDVDGEPD